MLEKLKQEVLDANLALVDHNLIKFTWGNVSAIDRESNLIVIKPSGVEYSKLTVDDMVVVNLDGETVEGKMNPSSDTKTHIELYKHFKDIGSIVHTHSKWATIWAQSTRDIPAYGTTHADTFYTEIPCARFLTKNEVDEDYERATGSLIIETFRSRNLDEMATPGILLSGHGPFAWGKDSTQAVYNAVVLEEVAQMALLTEQLNTEVKPLMQTVLDKHYLRKHGKDAYYGQKGNENE